MEHVHIRREPRRLGDEVTTRPQTATAEAMARLGAGMVRKRMVKTTECSGELQCKQSLIVDKDTEESGSTKGPGDFFSWDGVSIWGQMLRTMCEVTDTIAQNIFSRLGGAQWDTGKWLGSWSRNPFVVIAPKSGYCESNTFLLVDKQYRQP